MAERTPDPIDRAYSDAEKLLDDAAERSARRARVLAAVVEDKPVGHQASAPRFASRYGWLVAASVMVVSGYLVLRFLPLQQIGSPPIQQTAAVKPSQKNQMTAALSPPAPVNARMRATIFGRDPGEGIPVTLARHPPIEVHETGGDGRVR